MSYDVLLSQLAEEKLAVFDESDQSKNDEEKPKNSEGSTPSRKVSTSRFLNAFSQFYGNVEDDQNASCSNSSSSNRTPTRGMESKLMSMWHNVKYGWSGKIRSNFSKEQPVWLLGRCYHKKCTPPSSMESSIELTSSLENRAKEPNSEIYENLSVQELAMDAIENQISDNPWEEGIDGFKRDFHSRLWMTYRREFPIMNGSNYTSDCGWGCMLRSGQMLLAQALLCHFLGRSWRWDPDTQIHSTYEDNMHRKIIKWFGDSSSKNSPFSIHALVNIGQDVGKKAGDWYGPSSVSYLLRQAVKQAALENADFDDLNVYVAKECTGFFTMSYDVLLSQLAEEKLAVFDESDQSKNDEEKPKNSEGSTPSRKVSTSRFLNAFSQFYGNVEDDQNASCSNSSSSNRTPTRGMESKLMSMWHNVKYGWSGKIRSNFSKEQPVWLLGRCYHKKCTPPSSMESSIELTSSLENRAKEPNSEIYENLSVQELAMDAIENQISDNPWEEGIDGFKRDFHSRLWMTYRREFPIMNGSNYTSDCGWGCMLRSGQMLLAQALLCHFLGRSWRWDPDTQIHSTYEDNMHRKIIKWFGDSSSKNSPFSIHALVNIGQDVGKKAGDWYGPSSVSYLLRQAVKQAALENADFDDLNVYVAKECTVYIQDVLDECLIPERPAGFSVPWQLSSDQPDQRTVEAQMHWKALILLIPLRLGADKLNPSYAHCLKILLSTEYCIGIIGGRPKHALYFVGFQEDKLIHLDPHYCQEMVDVNQENFPVHSFHCKSPRKLKVTRIDPSCCIGFYCQTKLDFDNFMSTVEPYLHPSRSAAIAFEKQISGNSSSYQETQYPLFVFDNGRCQDHHKKDIVESVYKPLQQQLCYLRQQLCNDDDDDDETEEFVII